MGRVGGKEFERDIVRAFNIFYIENGIEALAYRRWAPEKVRQEFDVVCDSKDIRYYLAIECKSISDRYTNSLYFTQHFSTSADGHQIEREWEWAQKTGRIPFLAVEIRSGSGKYREAYLVPYRVVYDLYMKGTTRLLLTGVRMYNRIRREGKGYIVDESILQYE